MQSRKSHEGYGLPPRLAVVAAIIEGGEVSHGPLASAARLGDEIHSKARSATAATATAAEQALAQALQDSGQCDEPSTDHAIAELLLLADDGPEAGMLAIGLSQTFLLPDDSKALLAREERRSAFADLYRRLALHQLNSQVRNKAAAILCRLRRRDAAT
jgi:hypothetical protein